MMFHHDGLRTITAEKARTAQKIRASPSDHLLNPVVSCNIIADIFSTRCERQES
ncbi:hypothetical protein K474DRAFT_1663313 [Panus rudis PR-1116 ss-1]|nr:hypothetical protein K474DRAFT_1663313 [Panus rudis PR-1116 ss-1]